jgi:hypothetical protein
VLTAATASLPIWADDPVNGYMTPTFTSCAKLVTETQNNDKKAKIESKYFFIIFPYFS